jgi:hypothetical protein
MRLAALFVIAAPPLRFGRDGVVMRLSALRKILGRFVRCGFAAPPSERSWPLRRFGCATPPCATARLCALRRYGLFDFEQARFDEALHFRGLFLHERIELLGLATRDFEAELIEPLLHIGQREGLVDLRV